MISGSFVDSDKIEKFLKILLDFYPPPPNIYLEQEHMVVVMKEKRFERLGMENILVSVFAQSSGKHATVLK